MLIADSPYKTYERKFFELKASYLDSNLNPYKTKSSIKSNYIIIKDSSINIHLFAFLLLTELKAGIQTSVYVIVLLGWEYVEVSHI